MKYKDATTDLTENARLIIPMNLPKVLIVDDEVEIASNLAEALTVAQFEVVVAHDWTSGQSAAEGQEFDIVLIDLRLPDGNGLDLARQIRAVSATPVVMMSGKADDIDRILGLEMVADDYLQKPFSQRELVARFRAILRRYEPAANDNAEAARSRTTTHASFHGYTLDHAAREVTSSDGHSVDLTTREFDVLAVLAENQGKVLSRQEIYLAAGMGKGHADRQIDGLISRLRTKLFQDSAAARKIRTVHGRGYVLTDH